MENRFYILIVPSPFSFPVDITVYHGGFHGDLNETLFVGKVDDTSRKLVQMAYECMMKGISIGRPDSALRCTSMLGLATAF